MAVTNVGRAMDFLLGVVTGDPDLATRHVDPDASVEHDRRAVGSATDLWKSVDRLPKSSADAGVIRVLEDGPVIVAQHQGGTAGRMVVFEVFRFAGEWIVEHWGFSSENGSPNRSSHTQADGPTRWIASELTLLAMTIGGFGPVRPVRPLVRRP